MRVSFKEGKVVIGKNEFSGYIWVVKTRSMV